MENKEPNYNETVIIPMLQKKYTDLLNANLVLEAGLLVERARTEHLKKIIQSMEPRAEQGIKKKKKDHIEPDGGQF